MAIKPALNFRLILNFDDIMTTRANIVEFGKLIAGKLWYLSIPTYRVLMHSTSCLDGFPTITGSLPAAVCTAVTKQPVPTTTK